MIEGVETRELRLEEERSGWSVVVHGDGGPGFRPSYVSVTTLRPGKVDAWYLHASRTDRIACLQGTVELALHDGREDSETRGETSTAFIGERSPRVVTVPPGVYHGVKNVGSRAALVQVLADGTAEDAETLPPDAEEIGYDWGGTATHRLI